MSKILYTLHVINSRSDIYGNRYFAMIVTRTEDGATAHGLISGGESNCTLAVNKLAGGWDRYEYTTAELPIREYNRKVKGWPYLGCTPEDINPKILEQMEGK